LGIFAKVQLEGEEGGLVTEGLTDSDGRYHFEGLTGAAYRLIVTADGFEKQEEFIQSSMGVQLTICNVTLKPLPKDSDKAASSQPRPDRLAPKQARKEYEKATKELAAQHLDKAESYLQSAVKLYPCYAAAQAHLAPILEGHHDPAGAEAALRKAIQCDPDYVSSYTLLGQLLNQQKRFAESVPSLEVAERPLPAS
jgi:tetratricopeptide (TPR) repeat protein